MSDNDLETVRSIMKDVRVAMLTSISAEGALTSRPMATEEAEFDGDAWFVTARGSDLAQEVGAQSAVNVSYSHTDSWLSLSGHAEVVDDHAKKAELWNGVLETWFPHGRDDESTVLVKVTAESAQFWEAPGKVATLVDMAKARVTGTQADVGDSGTLQL